MNLSIKAIIHGSIYFVIRTSVCGIYLKCDFYLEIQYIPAGSPGSKTPSPFRVGHEQLQRLSQVICWGMRAESGRSATPTCTPSWTAASIDTKTKPYEAKEKMQNRDDSYSLTPHTSSTTMWPAHSTIALVWSVWLAHCALNERPPMP